MTVIGHIRQIPSSHQPVLWISGCFLSLDDKVDDKVVVRDSYQIGFTLILDCGSFRTYSLDNSSSFVNMLQKKKTLKLHLTFYLAGSNWSSIALLPLALSSSGFHVATGYVPRSANQKAFPPLHTINRLPCCGVEPCWQWDVNVSMTTSCRHGSLS